MSVLPSLEAQHEIIRGIKEKKKLREGDANIISYKWYKKWEISANGEIILPIDNSGILDENGVIDGLKKNKDYKIITTDEWDQLYSWYRGGPEQRITIMKSPRDGRLVPNLRVYKYKVFLQEKVATIANDNVMTTIKEIKSKACSYFKIDSDKYVLTHYKEGKVGDDIDDSMHLYELNTARNFSLKKVSKKLHMVQSKSYSHLQKGQVNGICGLYNLGNTCYFNAALQCLAHTIPLIDYLALGEWKHHINADNKFGTQGRAISAFDSIVENIWTGKSSAVNPQELKSCISEKYKVFSGFRQQDSQELLVFLLDLLHEDLNSCRERVPLNIKDGDGTNDEEIANETIRQRGVNNNSPIYTMFFGLLKSKLVCPDCHNASVCFDPFSSLSLPLSYRTKYSPVINFIPLEPTGKILVFRLVLSDEGETMESISSSISGLIGKDVSIALAKSTESGQMLDFIKDPNDMASSGTYYAFEIDKSKFYCISYPCFLHSGVIKPYPEILSRPCLVELPADNATSEQLEPIMEEFYSYLFVPLPKEETVKTSFQRKLNSAVDFEPATDKKIVCILEKHMFSKTMRFKPDPNAPCIARRRVYAVINKEVLSDTSKFNYRKLTPTTERIQSGCQPPMTLDSCLEMFETESALSQTERWMCPHCKKPVCALKKMDIWSAPKILIIHLKRFFLTRKGYSKCDAKVEYPDILDIAPYLSHPAEKTKYKLYAVINHMGTMNGGHYISHCLVNDKWIEFNDSHASECDFVAVHARSAYVLFYQLIE